MNTIDQVREFHLAFGHPVAAEITDPGGKHKLLRFKLIFEELMEFGRAIGIVGLAEMPQADFEAQLKDGLDAFALHPSFPVDHIEAADALGDLDYVVQGSNLVFGYPAGAVLAEIHRANMSKLGSDGKPILAENGKVVKSENYIPPNIASVLWPTS